MMCQASTALIASLLACVLPTELFGTHTIPGHIYVAWISGPVYVRIETTIFNAEAYSAVGIEYTYVLPPPQPVTNVPYIFLDPNNEEEAAKVLYAVESRENETLLTEYSTFSPLFPFADGRDITCKGASLQHIYLLNDQTLRVTFPVTSTPAALQAFAEHHIIEPCRLSHTEQVTLPWGTIVVQLGTISSMSRRRTLVSFLALSKL